MRATLVRWESAWLAVCVLGWLLLSFGGGESEAECRAQGGWVCFSTGELLVVLGLYGLFVWIAGGVIIVFVWMIARWLRGASAHADEDWSDDVL